LDYYYITLADKKLTALGYTVSLVCICTFIQVKLNYRIHWAYRRYRIHQPI